MDPLSCLSSILFIEHLFAVGSSDISIMLQPYFVLSILEYFDSDSIFDAHETSSRNLQKFTNHCSNHQSKYLSASERSNDQRKEKFELSASTLRGTYVTHAFKSQGSRRNYSRVGTQSTNCEDHISGLLDQSSFQMLSEKYKCNQSGKR